MDDLGAVSDRGLVRPESFIWLVVAAAFFAGAAVLTERVTWVAPVDGVFDSDLRVQAYGTRGVPVELKVASDEKQTTLVFSELRPGIATIDIEGIMARATCAYDELRLIDGSYQRVPEHIGRFQAATVLAGEVLPKPSTYEVHVADIGAALQGVPLESFGKPETIYSAAITCTLPPLVRRDTYVSRSLNIDLGGTDSVSNAALPIRVRIDEPDAELVYLTNLASGETREALATMNPSFGMWLVKWDSISYAARRDAAFVVIGTLVALGAAAVIEALRPYLAIYLAWLKERDRLMSR